MDSFWALPGGVPFPAGPRESPLRRSWAHVILGACRLDVSMVSKCLTNPQSPGGKCTAVSFPETPTLEGLVTGEETGLHQRLWPYPFSSGLVGWIYDQENTVKKKKNCPSVYKVHIISQRWAVQDQETPRGCPWAEGGLSLSTSFRGRSPRSSFSSCPGQHPRARPPLGRGRRGPREWLQPTPALGDSSRPPAHLPPICV